MILSTKAYRYAVIGAVAFAIDYGVTLLIMTVSPLLVANTLGFLAANLGIFLMGHGWVFQQEWSRTHLLAKYFSVLGVSVVGLLVSNLLVWALVGVSGATLLVGKVVATAVVMVWNFLARTLWVYKKTIVL